MTLGQIIHEYREAHNMSMATFAERSGMSKAYIGVLEKGVHPNTGKPIAPSVDTIKNAADAMRVDFEGGIKYNDVRRGKQRYLLHFTVRADVKNCKVLPYFCPTKNSPPDGSPRGLFRKE